MAAVEAAYRLDIDDEAWLDQMLQAVAPLLDRGVGLAAYYADVFVEPKPRAWGSRVFGATHEVSAFDSGRAELDPEVERAAYLAGPMLVSSLDLPDYHDRLLGIIDRYGGPQDSWGLMAFDAEGRGAAFSALSAERLHPTPGTRRVLERVSIHMATALRLRRRLHPPEAILESDGRVAHAEGAAARPAVLEVLRQAAVSADRARTRAGRADPDEALDAWQALVSGRWSVVDTFDTDGRRYFVVRPNEPEAPDPRGLTDRERQVIAMRALGHRQKAIAYALGIARSTAAAHERSARRKLGGLSDAEISQLFRQLGTG